MALIGVGIYTPAEAAKLIGTESREVKRWLFGYAFRAHGASDRRNSPPLWTSQHAEDGQLVGFRDLLELRIVKAFVKHGVSLLVIRRVLENAQQMFGHSYPFTAMRFLTDGRTIFHEASKHSGDGGLTDLKSKQVVFTEVIRHSLYAGIEFAHGTEDNARFKGAGLSCWIPKFLLGNLSFPGRGFLLPRSPMR